MGIEFTCENDDGDEEVHGLPSKKEVCSRCEGEGTHLRQAIGEYAYTMEEFEEAFPEDEDKEEYFKRGGKYDITCVDCNGLRVVDVVDEDRCNNDPSLKLLLEKYSNSKKKMLNMIRSAPWNG